MASVLCRVFCVGNRLSKVFIKDSVTRWPKSRPKSSKGAKEIKSWPEESVGSGKKGAEENFL
jgi:hypothetical protein